MSTGSQEGTSDPWAPQGREFERLYDRAGKLLKTPTEYYPDSTIADRSQLEIEAGSNVAGMVRGGSAGLGTAVSMNERIASGEFLESGFPSIEENPYLRDVGQSAADDITRNFNQAVMPGIASRFAGAGRSVGARGGPNAESVAMGSAQRGLGQELSQMYSNLYGSAYESERDRQFAGREQALDRQVGAISAAPGLRQAEFGEQTALASAGREEFEYNQLRLSDLVERFNFSQDELYNRLGRFSNLISQPSGYGTTEQTGKLGTAQKVGVAGSFLTPFVDYGLKG